MSKYVSAMVITEASVCWIISNSHVMNNCLCCMLFKDRKLYPLEEDNLVMPRPHFFLLFSE